MSKLHTTSHTATDRVRYLDGWRACAILAVLFGHFITTKGINLGRFGVELFFVLSGRLMAEILFVRNTPLTSFFPRRFSRIYPAMFVLAFCMLLWRIITASTDPTNGQLAAAITLTANYAQFWTGRSQLLDHIWSLCIEEHIYILLGLLALVHRWRPLPVAAIFLSVAFLAIINGIFQTARGGGYYAVYWRTDVRGASILLGAASYLLLREKIPRALNFAWVPIALCTLAIVLNIRAVPDPIKYSIGTASLAIGLVIMHRSPVFILKILEHPLLLRIGVWSYSIYLWQQPFAKEGEGGALVRAILLVASIVAALASFYIVEQPVRLYLNRRWHTRKAPVKEGQP
jgi:peptidoglycan/LPS O-acetylase OafA/YrhL